MRTKESKNHGLSKTPFYRVWTNMKSRCFYKKDKKYKHYGGRGITVCEEWLDFMNFKNDMHESYLKHKTNHGITTIERKNNNCNYCLLNCCWATRKEQIQNRFSKPPPKNNSKTITINITDNQHGILKRKIGSNMSASIRQAIDDYLSVT